LVQDRAAFATSDIRKSFRAIAKKLNVEEVTVRRRVQKMQKTGFLQYWTVMVNPSLLGLKVAQLSFEALPATSKSDLIEQLKLLPGSLVVVDWFGRSLFFSFFYLDDGSLQRQIELVRRMSNATNLVSSPIPTPECRMKLKETDWNILRILQRDARKSFSEVATKLGVSTRTVKRRLDRMIDERAVFILPSMNPNALEGVTQADLLVVYRDSKSKAGLDQRFTTLWDDYVARAETGNPESSFFNLFVKNISQAQEVLNWTREQPGVKNARLDLVQNRYELYDALSKEVDMKIQRLYATPLRSSPN